jgi:hypothetical protein
MTSDAPAPDERDARDRESIPWFVREPEGDR